MTYGELRERLLAMNEKQLGMRVRVATPDGGRERLIDVAEIGDETGRPMHKTDARKAVYLFATTKPEA
jgi:hypothetical protein